MAALALAACAGTEPPKPVAKPAVPVATAPPVAPPAPWPDLNLGFEQVTGEAPVGWDSDSSYVWAVVGDVKHGGERSLRVVSADNSTFGPVIASAPAEPVRGKHLKLHCWMKTQGARGTAAMFLAVEGGGGAFDNRHEEGITGTTDWTEASVEVDVPEKGERVVFGPMLIGAGTAWFDDLRFEVIERPTHPIILEGTVVDAGGAPVAGADVGLVSTIGVQAHIASDAAGRFHFEAPAGRWGLSAHHLGSVDGFVDASWFFADHKAISIALGASDGVVVHGKVGPAKPAPGAYVELGIPSKYVGDSFAVPVAADGTFEATLPRSRAYNAALLSGGAGAASAATIGDRADITIAMAELSPPPREVVDWIAAHAFPLAGVEPERDVEDLAPMARLIGHARVVALGEATHGTREFFQLKHRVIEYLVAKQGFTVFAIEANQPECRAINDYVLHGRGDPRAALDGIYFWTWNTEEVLAMIEWMRAWNADPAHRNKVQFHGFDMQKSHVAYASVAAYLTRLAPEAAPGLLAPLALFGSSAARRTIAKLTDEERKPLGDGLAALAKAFDAHRATWRRSSPAVFDDVRHDLTILEQAAELYAHDGIGAGVRNIRDKAMAANVRWLLDHQPAGTRMVVWAHDGHIANDGAAGNGLQNLGGHLRRQLGTRYVSLGFVFSQGSFRAVDANNGSLHAISLGEPPESHASVAFARTGKPLLVLDLRALPRNGIVHDWFTAPHPVRSTGSEFETELKMTMNVVLPDLFDAVIFVDKTTASRSLN